MSVNVWGEVNMWEATSGVAPPVDSGGFLEGVVESVVSSVLQPLVCKGKFSAFNEDGTTNF